MVLPEIRNGAQRASRHLGRTRLHLVVLATLFAVALVPVQAPTSAQATHTTEASRVIASAKHHIGARWSYGATGPYSFDCSGLVYHAFREAGLASRIGGRNTASGYYSYFRSRGLTSRSNPRRGDLVVYGYSGRPSHIGIYIGNGYVIGTLTSGVKIHRTFAVTKPFIAYLRVRLTR